MSRLIRLTAVVFISLLVLSGCSSKETIEILHFNDFHAFLLPEEVVVKEGDKDVRKEGGSGAARLARAVKDRKGAGNLVLFGGDAIQGTAFSTLFKGEESFSVLNEFVDVATIGNHEFDYGIDNLKQRLAEAKFDVVCANVLDEDGEKFISQAYVVREVKGVRVAIFGLVTETTAYTTSPKNVASLTFINPVAAAKDLVPKLRAEEKADVVIALTHMGSDEDVKLAKEVTDIDLIVGGHSHTALTNGIKIGKTQIVQAGYYGKYLGIAKLEIDSGTKKVTGTSARLIPMTQDLPKDEVVEAKVAEYNKKLGDAVQEVIAHATVRLEGEKSKVRNEETNLGNLICDITRDIAKADLAMVNGGGIRDSIEAGDIRVNDFINVIPFDNVIVVVDLPGSAIAKLLDRSAAKEPQTGNFLHVSGGSGYTITRDGKAVNIMLAGAPIDPGRTYRVATSDFLATGGDGFEEFKDGRAFDTGFMMRDAIIDVVRARGVLNAGLEGRIKKQ